MISSFFTKGSRYFPFTKKQKKQKAVLEKRKLGKSALGKEGRLGRKFAGIDSRARPKGGPQGRAR